MNIILNEYETAERAIGEHTLGKNPVETLRCVSKYYLENRYSKADTRRLLDQFLVQCDPQVSVVRWSDTLDRIVRKAGKHPLIRLDGIEVTKPELAAIERLEGTQTRRLAFTLLCVAKYWDTISEKNHHWVNTPDSEVMKMANIRTSIKRQCAMFTSLRDDGLIRFSRKVDNLNVQVLFMQDGERAMYIRDFRNLGYQYMMFYGGPYYECVNCGLTVKIQKPARGRPPKYCPSCAVELHTRQKVDSVMRHRNAVKS